MHGLLEQLSSNPMSLPVIRHGHPQLDFVRLRMGEAQVAHDQICV
jgi:hypothetical protein